MSISFTLRRQKITDSIVLPQGTNGLSCQMLSQQIKQKLNLATTQSFTILNPITGLGYNLHQLIPSGSVVSVEKTVKQVPKDLLVNDIIGKQQLDAIAENAKFFVIRSSNEENIQKAKDQSVWATTYSNQEKLKAAYMYSPHVLLIFATNRSYELKGVARMESQPMKVPDKTFWAGVGNIRLGGNFRIRWIRKKSLNCALIEKAFGTQVKDQIMRLSDGQQAESEACKKMIQLFEVPKEPDLVMRTEQKRQSQGRVAKLSQIIGIGQSRRPGMPMLPPPSITNPVISSQPTKQSINITPPFTMPQLNNPLFMPLVSTPQQLQQRNTELYKRPESLRQHEQKQKQTHKHKSKTKKHSRSKRKDIKRRRKHRKSKYSSASDSNSSRSSSQSSSSDQSSSSESDSESSQRIQRKKTHRRKDENKKNRRSSYEKEIKKKKSKRSKGHKRH